MDLNDDIIEPFNYKRKKSKAVELPKVETLEKVENQRSIELINLYK